MNAHVIRAASITTQCCNSDTTKREVRINGIPVGEPFISWDQAESISRFLDINRTEIVRLLNEG